jgi:Asp-tRNA(Asn)/Glu-tRNA(Gln) amidotransferase A subunit family amidase
MRPGQARIESRHEVKACMADSRREFLRVSAMGVMGAAMVGASGADVEGQAATGQAQTPQEQVPGATPAFGTASPTGPAVTAGTFAEAEKLAQVTMTPAEQTEAAGNWQQSMAALYERRNGPRKVALGEADAPATVWNPTLKKPFGVDMHVSNAPTAYAVDELQWPLPKAHEDIAFAPVWRLAQWVSSGELSSVRLTNIYLARLKKYQPVLSCVITLCEEHALEQARAADKEIAVGKYRGPLHGIPWGAKDLLDTAGIRTTWGAEFNEHRVPTVDAAVVKKLNDAGAVLVAKLSLGALALNDIWFGGQTKNPWCLEEGSSGSSAGPGSAVGAGLVGFAIGSETQGSIISPSMRCGVTGLRPTYGQVPRTGAMVLSWTCDKLGPMARSVEDAMLVLQAISGNDAGDTASNSKPFAWSDSTDLYGLRVGYVAKWMNSAPAIDLDRQALEVCRKLGMTAVPVTLPDWPYASLNAILFAESAAAFEAETLDGRLNELKMQVPDAWPNTFRQSRFVSAVDYVQADRMRRKVAVEVAKMFEGIDVLLVPSLGDDPMVIFNFTGNPSLTLRAGFVEIGEARSDWAPDPKNPLPKFNPKRRVPYGVTLIGGLFDEVALGRVGIAMEREFGVASERPKGFA